MNNKQHHASRPGNKPPRIDRLLRLDDKDAPLRVAVRTAGAYLLFGLLWILFSDKIVNMMFNDKDTITRISMIKGWIYVLMSAILIFWLIFSSVFRIRRSQEQLESQNDELREYQSLLHHMAYHDQLTSLPNRRALYEDVSEQFAANRPGTAALLFLDVDNFKLVNDVMGHSFGDELIRTLGLCVDDLTVEGMTTYRLGGDEFVIFLDGNPEREDVENLVERIKQCTKQPLSVSGSRIHVSMSVGIAIFPQDGTTMDSLLQSASIAMYRAKAEGKERHMFYNEEMKNHVTERVNLERHLRGALQGNEFELHFQPQMELSTGGIVSFEALLRWHNPVLGNVPPDSFIGIAEETHMILGIGEWVLRNACFYLKHLQQKGYTDITMSVNVSIVQLLQQDFVDVVQRSLDLMDIEPRYLELEVTESAMTDSFEVVIGQIVRLRDLGVRIALDDFGKGYSSLSYLKQLPIDTLKIDKSFVDDIQGVEDETNLSDMIIALGQRMGMTVVAEGIEVEEQLDYMKRHTCHRIQGYLIGKPMPGAAAMEFLEAWNRSDGRVL